MTEINLDFDINITFHDGGGRRVAVDKLVSVSDDPKRLVKEVRLAATRIINDLCGQLANATGYGYSGQPVVQDYAHKLVRVSAPAVPDVDGAGSLADIEVRPRSSLRSVWETADNDPGAEDDREAKGCTHPADEPCFGRKAPVSITGRDHYGVWYSKHTEPGRDFSVISMLEKDDPTMVEERLYLNNDLEMIRKNPRVQEEAITPDEIMVSSQEPEDADGFDNLDEVYKDPDVLGSEEDDVPPNAGSSS